MSKVMTTEHSEAIVHTLFLGQDAPGARSLRVISGDCKGRLLLHAFSQQIMPLLRRFSVETQVIAFKDKLNAFYYMECGSNFGNLLIPLKSYCLLHIVNIWT